MKPVPRNERGVVLLTTLLVMTLMATIAAALMDDVGFGVKRAVNGEANAQAQWYALAAEDFAAASVTQRLRGATPAQINQAMRKAEPTILPIEGGSIALNVRGGSQCFSLGQLATSQGQRQFTALMEALGIDTTTAQKIAYTAADWRDEDVQQLPNGGEDYAYLRMPAPYRAANTDFASVMELRAVEGMTEALYQVLRPFVCARPEDAASTININLLTLQQAPLLASLMGVENYQVALRLITERPESGYADVAVLQEAPALEGVDTSDIDFDGIGYAPDFLWVEADIRYSSARRTLVLEFARTGNTVQRSYRSFSAEALRPQLLSEGL